MWRSHLLLIAALLSAQGVWAEDAAPTAVPESESQQFARERLMEMAKFLAAKDAFSVTLGVAYDVVQDSGQKIEFGEIRELAIQRPKHVHIVEKGSDGEKNVLLFDGSNITVSNGVGGVYAQVPQPGDLDATVLYFVRDLRMRLPLAPMFMTRFPEELQRRVQSIEYVESTEILGEPAHHLAARTADVDFQVWIADSDRPLPLRIVLTYTQAEGQPQFRADFSKWDLAPRFGKATFAFKPPAGAQQIAFAAHFSAAPDMRKPDASQPDASLPTGDKP
jgi:hypothetical protein